MSRSTPSKIDPEMLAELNYDGQFVQSISTSRRQVKIEKGKSWRVRFLPAKLGPKKTFFARIAKHWLATKPIVCPRQTAPAFGGDPEAFCPICNRSDELNTSLNKAEQDLGYETRAAAQWLTYCVVFEKDGTEQSMQEVLIPYEFQMYKSAWEELKAFYAAGGHKSPLSVLDYRTGNDFIVMRTNKGIKLDKQDSQSIFDLQEPKYADWIKKIEEGIKQPRVTMPTEQELDTFLIKLEDAIAKLQPGGGARRGRAVVGLEENDDPQSDHVDEPETPRRPVARRPAPEPQPEADPAGDDDQLEGAEMPAKAPAPAAVAPRRPVAPAPAPARTAPAAVRPAAATSRRPAPAPVEQPDPDDVEDAERAAAGDPDAADPDPEPEPAPEPQRRAPVRPAATVRRQAAPPPPQPEDDAGDDPLPEDEVSDQAPPAPLEGEGDQPVAPPPAVSRKGALGAAIANKIQSVQKRGL